ncbi:hypothetical protein CISG_01143 [Coccidioides immitis RMSCC 3703]|uniref:Uncharacterized protein n=1 Tax=Coccidioides immitis RMSCC 3703 TaxID=454286 RepID=A0A0J8QU42_COCIT|nr:hypothetical protein CISG_01143 [Coccidioides immitis RMSCC 3703]
MVHARRKTTQRRVGPWLQMIRGRIRAVAHTYVQPAHVWYDRFSPSKPSVVIRLKKLGTGMASDQRVDVISVVCAGTYIMETLAFPAQKPSSLPDQGSFPAVC